MKKLSCLFLSAAIVGVLFFFGHGIFVAHADVEISDGSVIGLWHLDNTSSDATANGYNGTPTDISYTTGTLGSAASFNGTTSKIDLPSFTATDTTLVAWIKITSDCCPIIHLGNNSPQQMLWFDTDTGGNIRFAKYDGAYAQLATTGTNYADNGWHLIIGTRSGNTVCLYADDTYQGCSAISPSATVGGDRNAIGYDRYNNASHVNGLIDEVAVLNTVMSTSTRDALWNSGNGNPICVTSGCGGAPTYTPILSSPNQYKADGSTTLAGGASTAEHKVVFKGTLTSTSTNLLYMEVEVEPSTTAFTNVPTLTSTGVSSGTTASITFLTDTYFDGNYHWQARARDGVASTTSAWTSFGATATSTDFVIGGRPVGVEVTDGSLVGLWHLDSTSSDATANGYNGTPTDISYASGKFGDAASFNGSTSKIDLPSFNATDTTLMAWIKVTSKCCPIVHLGNNAPQQMLWFDTGASGEIRFAEYNGAYAQLASAGTNYADNGWHLIIGTRSGNNACLYADNVFQGCGAISPSTTVGGDRNAIGYDRYNNASHANGLIDEAAVFNTVINTSTRDNLWSDGNGQSICETAGCGGLGFSSSSQYSGNTTTTVLGIGSSTTDDQVTFRAIMQAPTGTAQLQVEWAYAGTSFTGNPTATSSFVASGTEAIVTIPFTANRSYHWQARAMNPYGTASSWIPFESSTDAIDFRVWSLDNAASEYFDGTSSLAYSAALDTFSATDPFTIEFWYRTPATSSVQDFIDSRSSSTHEGYVISRDTNLGIHFLLECDTSTIDFHVAASQANNNGGANDTAGIWHQVTIAKGSGTTTSTFNTYFDGAGPILDDSVGSAGPIAGKCFTSSSTDSIQFGEDALSPSNYSMTGNMDEVRIWNTQRSNADVSSTWNQELAATSTGLVGHWSFNNNSADLVTGHTATIIGSAVATSSSPFGHFVYNPPGSIASVTSTATGPQMLWRYDLNPGDSDYTSAITTSTAAWNALGAVVIASTTATSSMTLHIVDVYQVLGPWFEVPGQWQQSPATSSYGTLFLNEPYFPSTLDAQKFIVTHELGHALGLSHSYWGQIMNWEYNLSTDPYPKGLQDQDKSDYYFIWGGN